MNRDAYPEAPQHEVALILTLLVSLCAFGAMAVASILVLGAPVWAPHTRLDAGVGAAVASAVGSYAMLRVAIAAAHRL